ncbi:hypothetical protein [Longimicrobium sp.]|uniref:COG4315 family predicted lipoprotein n=1 Tax=Longimicrobium sp. TaxID=2029185 RepID=UPI002C566FEA|nr:hypothetical protein [Longimicrobium sp.]HSU13814.1 hypothetical protein [Longimicrobium sp.]
MNRRQILALSGAMTMCVLAACGGDRDGDDNGGGNVDSTASTAAAPAPATPVTAPGGTDTAAAAAQGGVQLTTGNAAGVGTFIADRTGRPLYMYTADKNGESACYEACAGLWPPLIGAQGAAAAGAAGVQSSMLGVSKRRDGSSQITYNQHPLYYYSADGGGNVPRGNDVKDAGGEWYLVTPAGAEAEDHDEHERHGDDDKS